MERKRDPNLRKLFSLYKKFPCLWNPKDPGFKDVLIRKCAWPVLRRHYIETCTHPAGPINIGMNNIMSKYTRLFHDEEKRRKDLVQVGMMHKPHFLYYEDLIFLKGTKRLPLVKVKPNQNEKKKLTNSNTDEDDIWNKWLENIKRLPLKEQNHIFDSVLKHRQGEGAFEGPTAPQRQTSAEPPSVNNKGFNPPAPGQPIVFPANVAKKAVEQPKIHGFRKSSKSLHPEKKSKLDEQLINMIAKGYHSLHLIEEPEFIKFLSMLCPSYILPTTKALSDVFLPKLHLKLAEQVKNKIANAPAICLTLDAGTSANNESFIAVAAYYVDSETGKMCSNLISCVEYDKHQRDENLCEFLKNEESKWGIGNKIGAVVSTNAANILGAIQLAGWRPVGCFAHLLNLTVQAGIEQISAVVKKVQNVVEFFKRSSHGFQKLHEIQKFMEVPILKLKQGVMTRWNSIYDMLERVLKIKDALVVTLPSVRKDLSLVKQDWAVIERVVSILKAFIEVTVEISKEKYVSLSIVIIYFRLLKQHIRQRLSEAEAAQDTSEVKHFLKTLHEQICRRCEDIETNVLYAEATILDPRFKGRGFDNQSNCKNALAALKNKIATEKRPSVQNEVPRASPSRSSIAQYKIPLISSASTTKEPSIWNEFDAIIPEYCTVAGISELNKYLNEPVIQRSEDPLLWWHARKSTYPHLYRHVLKRLNLVATSVPSIFSKAELILADRRTWFSSKKVSQLLFIGSNL